MDTIETLQNIPGGHTWKPAKFNKGFFDTYYCNVCSIEIGECNYRDTEWQWGVGEYSYFDEMNCTYINVGGEPIFGYPAIQSCAEIIMKKALG